MPNEEKSYGGSISFPRHKGGEAKLAVETLKEIKPPSGSGANAELHP